MKILVGVFVCLVSTSVAFAQVHAVHPAHPQVAQKPNYSGPSDCKWYSAQGHYQDDVMTHAQVSHLHVELCAQPYAVIPRNETFTLPGRVVLYHMAGRVPLNSVYVYWLARPLVWESPGDIVGNPNGVVTRHFTMTIDAANGQAIDPFNRFSYRPDHGWFHVGVTAFLQFETMRPNGGVEFNTELIIPFYSGDPAATPTHQGTEFVLSGRSSGGQLGTGEIISEYKNVFFPIAPVNARTTVPGISWAYLISQQWPASQPWHWFQVNDLDLHNGVPGTELGRRTFSPNDGQLQFTSDVVIDPAVLSPGEHKIALWGEQATGTGNASFPANLTRATLLVALVDVGTGTLPPTEPVPCGGTWGWSFSDSGNQRFFTRTFTVSPFSAPNCVRPTVPQGG